MSPRYGNLSAAEIEKLLSFEGTPRELIDYIGQLWSFKGPGTLEAKTASQAADDGWAPRDYFRWRIATGGESRNEDVIGELENTMFWYMYWESIHRGGGYDFHIPQEVMDIPGFLGGLKHYEAKQQREAASNSSHDFTGFPQKIHPGHGTWKAEL